MRSGGAGGRHSLAGRLASSTRRHALLQHQTQLGLNAALLTVCTATLTSGLHTDRHRPNGKLKNRRNSTEQYNVKCRPIAQQTYVPSIGVLVERERLLVDV